MINIKQRKILVKIVPRVKIIEPKKIKNMMKNKNHHHHFSYLESGPARLYVARLLLDDRGKMLPDELGHASR